MSETYRQQAFGRPTFIDASASGSSSGRDHFDILDATTLYHDHEFQGRRVQPLHIPAQDGYPQGHQFAYASHSSSVSLPGKRCRLFNPSQRPSHVGHLQRRRRPGTFDLVRSLPAVTIPTLLGCQSWMTFVGTWIACSARASHAPPQQVDVTSVTPT